MKRCPVCTCIVHDGRADGHPSENGWCSCTVGSNPKLEAVRLLVMQGAHRWGIRLNGGAVSVKKIKFTKTGKWSVTNEIDGTHQYLTDAELWKHSNIGEAIDKDAFVPYP